jgi:hypothetical protein
MTARRVVGRSIVECVSPSTGELADKQIINARIVEYFGLVNSFFITYVNL